MAGAALLLGSRCSALAHRNEVQHALLDLDLDVGRPDAFLRKQAELREQRILVRNLHDGVRHVADGVARVAQEIELHGVCVLSTSEA